MIRSALAALALLAATGLRAEAPAPPPARAPAATLASQIDTILAQAPKGTRLGLLVVDAEGRTIYARDEDQRFVPASNTKLFTTAAAYAVLGGDPAATEAAGATSLGLQPRRKGPPDLVLRGGGGVSLSVLPDCARQCLSSLVGQIATHTRKVRDVVIDDSLFTGPRWSPGMGWNNIGTVSGTAVSAVLIDDSEAVLKIAPGAPGSPPGIEAPGWFSLDNRATTVASGSSGLAIDRQPQSRVIRITGSIAADAPARVQRIGLDEPAAYAGWALAGLLKAQGIAIKGAIRTGPPDAPDLRAKGKGFALVVPAVPLDEEIARINKDSQNVHAEALLRRVGLGGAAQDLSASDDPGQDSLERGLAVARKALAPAALPAGGVELYDGSGMSTYNRVTPRATVALLRWAAGQDWGSRFKASLAVGGVDGTIRRRFLGTPLQGRIRAKSGTLFATGALSGYLTAASGHELTFAVFANDGPDGASATAVIDAVLLAVAAGS